MSVNTDPQVEGRLAAIELILAQALTFVLLQDGLDRPQLLASLREQLALRQSRLDPAARPHAEDCLERIATAAAATATQIADYARKHYSPPPSLQP